MVLSKLCQRTNRAAAHSGEEAEATRLGARERATTPGDIPREFDDVGL
jgi:hypothetical protein